MKEILGCEVVRRVHNNCNDMLVQKELIMTLQRYNFWMSHAPGQGLLSKQSFTK